jgi:hypothetical protein
MPRRTLAAPRCTLPFTRPRDPVQTVLTMVRSKEDVGIEVAW